jgi:hypothetical protein
MLPQNAELSPRSLNFVKALEFTIPWETGREVDGSLRRDGGLHYRDGGKPTKYGIWAGANPDVDVANLDLSKAIELYKERYWLPYLGEKPVSFNPDAGELGLAVSLFDAGVNTGVGRAWSWFLQSYKEKDPAKALNALRGSFYSAKKDNSNYGGWMNRLNDLKKYVDVLRAS